VAVEAVNTNYNSIKQLVKESNNRLGREDFLKLLITQLQNQDPLNPMQDTEFIAQMAQFHTLEEITELNDSVGLSRAFNLVGKYVFASVNEDGVNRLIGGIVEKVSVINGEVYATIGSSLVKASDIVEVINSQNIQDKEVL